MIEGIMYIDSGKVFFIKRFRYDFMNLLKFWIMDGGFFVSIWKDYFKKLKYIVIKGEKLE